MDIDGLVAEGAAVEQDAVRELRKLEKRGFKTLAEQIQAECDLAFWALKPLMDERMVRLRLYNNQKRDRDAVGDPLMFTTHQTVLASLYADTLGATFTGREEGDQPAAEAVSSMATFDAAEMEKDVLDYIWDFDATLFGVGLLDMSAYDRTRLVPVPEVWDPLATIYDPRATSVNGNAKGSGACRFIGREVRLTKLDMERARVYFNLDKLKASDPNDIQSLVDQGSQARDEASGLATATLGKQLTGDNADYRIREHFTYYRGKPVLASLANGFKDVVRYRELDLATRFNGRSVWPIIDRRLYPLSHSFHGVSIGDLTEDKQRKRASVMNMGLKVVRADLHRQYVYDNTRITNRRDLDLGTEKYIGVAGNTNGVIVPVQRDPVKAEVQWILDSLANAAQQATATPEIQQGQVTRGSQTLGELKMVKNEVNTRYSLSARIFGWSERRFWQEYLRQQKLNFTDVDTKQIRIAGPLGPKWREVSREDFVGSQDPDIEVQSQVVGEADRMNRFAILRAFLQMVEADPSTNMRFARRKAGQLVGLRADELSQLMPPTIDELEAEAENELLADGKAAEVKPTQDHVTHIEKHNQLPDGKVKDAHIKAHRTMMAAKRERPDLFPVEPEAGAPVSSMNPKPGSMISGGRAAPVAATVPPSLQR